MKYFYNATPKHERPKATPENVGDLLRIDGGVYRCDAVTADGRLVCHRLTNGHEETIRLGERRRYDVGGVMVLGHSHDAAAKIARDAARGRC